MIKKTFFSEVVGAMTQILFVFVVGNVAFRLLQIEETFSLIAAAFIVLFYEGWKVLND